ncbi:YrhB domain-containing protein [Cupriavidus pauculus]|uniref:YrhB domain-containing protein n=1 Tax=Cupriavidus pauculus TaxID=82633 RepID=UPI003857BB65
MSLKIVRRQDLPYGWLFFYNSRDDLQSGEISSMLAENSPFIVDAVDGSLHVLGTALPVDAYLRKYESTRAHVKR